MRSSPADQHQGHAFDEVPYFEGCLPVEEMASRGRETLRFGPMKPVGLVDPKTGREPHAVVQLRREDRAGQMWNLVGFQTRLRIPEQQRVFRMIPGLEGAEFLRYGSIHRNSYLNSPAGLGPGLTAPAMTGCSSRGRSPGSRGTPSRSARGSWPASTWRALLQRHPGRRPTADHHARRIVSLSARRRSEAFPADERQLRSSRSASGEGEEGSQEGAAGRARAGGLLTLARAIGGTPWK